MTPAVSILISCRPNHPEYIRGALESLRQLTTEKSAVEILIKVDIGDVYTLTEVLGYEKDLFIKIIRMDGSKKRLGLVEYTNKLAEESTGRFLWFWSDETRVLTEGWQGRFRAMDSLADTLVLLFVEDTKGAGDIYPIISRKLYQAAGRFCGHIAVDTWWEAIHSRSVLPVDRKMLTGLEIKDSTVCGETKPERDSDDYLKFYSPVNLSEIKWELKKIEKSIPKI